MHRGPARLRACAPLLRLGGLGAEARGLGSRPNDEHDHSTGLGEAPLRRPAGLHVRIDGRRVRLPNPQTTIEGSLRQLDARAVVLRGKGDVEDFVVPAESISRLEVRRTESRKKKAATRGLLIGLAVGAVVGAVAGSGDGGMGVDTTGAVAAAGAIVGAPLGALVGSLTAPGARWEEVGSLEVSASVRF